MKIKNYVEKQKQPLSPKKLSHYTRSAGDKYAKDAPNKSHIITITLALSTESRPVDSALC